MASIEEMRADITQSQALMAADYKRLDELKAVIRNAEALIGAAHKEIEEVLNPRLAATYKEIDGLMGEVRNANADNLLKPEDLRLFLVETLNTSSIQAIKRASDGGPRFSIVVGTSDGINIQGCTNAEVSCFPTGNRLELREGGMSDHVMFAELVGKMTVKLGPPIEDSYVNLYVWENVDLSLLKAEESSV